MIGPYPAAQRTIVLPSPTFGDQQALTAEVDLRRAVNGATYTYIKRKGHKSLTWEFRVGREKGMELRAFIKTCYASRVKVIDHNAQEWIGYFAVNPFELETTKRAGPRYLMPRPEQQIITIVFLAMVSGT